MAIRAGELELPAVIGAGEILYKKWTLNKLHINCAGRYGRNIIVKLVLFTQRIDHINSRKETRDSNDQNYVKLLEKCGYLPVSIPNVLILPDNQNEFCNEK